MSTVPQDNCPCKDMSCYDTTGECDCCSWLIESFVMPNEPGKETVEEEADEVEDVPTGRT